ncbi:MAG TPA: hypothetical protein VHH36_00995 [Candidatus Thermoplasmatota archaeon]|nr:hypothetical protein [Candidatus Thermoplasmatota archaeon]
MLKMLAPSTPGRRAVLARRVVIASALAVALCTAWMATLLINDPATAHPTVQMRSVERDGDYVAWTTVFAGADAHASAYYAADGRPDRVLLLRQGQVPALLAGEDVSPLRIFPPPETVFAQSTGFLDFPVPRSDCPPPTGGCLEGSVPVLAWVKGDAWRGSRVEDARLETLEREHGASSEGPVGVIVVHSRAHILTFSWTLPLAAALATAVGLAATAVWVHAERRHARSRPDLGGLGFAPPDGVGAEERLRLVRLTALYVESVGRSFVVSGFAILGATALVLHLGLPLSLDVSAGHFHYVPDAGERVDTLLIGGPLTVCAFALAVWGVAYARVRREIGRWRELSDRFERDAARMLGA